MAFTFKNPSRRQLPLIGELSFELQLAILGLLFVIGLLGTLSAIYTQSQTHARGAAYLSVSGQLRPLAQQIPKAAQNALDGQDKGFRELRQARSQFGLLMNGLDEGGVVNGATMPATSKEARPALEGVLSIWSAQDATIALVLGQEASLTALGALSDEAVKSRKTLIEGAEAAGGRLPYLVERVLRQTGDLAWSPDFSEATAEQLGKDLAAALPLAPTDSALAKSLARMQTAFTALPVDVKPLAGARGAGARMGKNSRALAESTADLIAAYEAELKDQTGTTVTASVAAALAVVALMLIVKLFNDDAHRRREEAEVRRRIAEAEKDATQNAILRLMNEMGDLADGNLTVRATVTQDITGSIADAINYTIESLAVLVGRINEAADGVTHASASAQATSGELLAATHAQSDEIKGATATVLDMAQAISTVSSTAEQSVQVANASLEAAQKGATAVANSISGMHEIRRQIQETAKRIKRLGESSQEIGEIVGLISDITEQTNVLALNAAIQAASAGEAGRGFSVVAEEVQRLAERSSEATRQISAIVRAIQTDTHDAAAAMESSTQGVVEGTRLSDAAGQTLAEITGVSQNLAHLILNFSGDTRQQAELARSVAAAMQNILEITEQTNSRTAETARSIGDLSALAAELKGSVAGFKV
jgi:twitching motility protein PilJ